MLLPRHARLRASIYVAKAIRSCDLLVVFGRAGLNLAQTQPSHGGNRGSNPLGDASAEHYLIE